MASIKKVIGTNGLPGPYDIYANTTTIHGNLTVIGNTTALETTNSTLTDTIIVLNDGEAGAGVTAGYAGIRVDRGLAPSYDFQFRESDDSFVVGLSGSYQVVATRQDAPINGGLAFYNNSQARFDTISSITTGSWIGRTEIADISSGLVALSYATSANAYNQITNYINPLLSAISGTLLNVPQSISNSISGYALKSTVAGLTGSLQTQITANIITISAGPGIMTGQNGSVWTISATVTGAADVGLRSEVIAISSGLDNRITVNTALDANQASQISAISGALINIPASIINSISGYTLLSTTAAISAFLLSTIAATSGQGGGTGGGGLLASGIQGRLACNTTDITYVITHPTINTNVEFPIVSLDVPTSGSDIFVQGVYERAPTSFKVVLSGVPISGYGILWHIGTVAVSGYTLLSTTSSISAGLDTRLSLVELTYATKAAPISGTYNTVIVNSQGIVTSGSNTSYLNSTDVLSGRIACDGINNIFTVNHAFINTSTKIPVAAMEVTDPNSDLFTVGIYNRTATSFNIVLSGIGSVSHAILWNIV